MTGLVSLQRGKRRWQLLLAAASLPGCCHACQVLGWAGAGALLVGQSGSHFCLGQCFLYLSLLAFGVPLGVLPVQHGADSACQVGTLVLVLLGTEWVCERRRTAVAVGAFAEEMRGRLDFIFIVHVLDISFSFVPSTNLILWRKSDYLNYSRSGILL